MGPTFESRLQALLTSLATHVEAWALALCDNLYENEIPVLPGEVAEIESLGEGMQIQRRAWRLVHELRVE